MDPETKDCRPLGPKRRWLVHSAVGAACWLGLKVLGFHWIKVRGKENIPRNARAQQLTIVANHISLMDCLYLVYAFCPGFVVKSEIYDVRLIGYLAGAVLQCVFVDRDSTGRFGTASNRILARQACEGGRNLCAFPEGTTLNDRYLISFRSGAFIAGKPVYPIALRYPFRWVSPRFGRETLFGTLLKIAKGLWWSLEVIHLPVYTPSADEQKDPKLFARNVRQCIAEAMNDPPVELRDITNADILVYNKGHVKEGRPASEFITPEEVEEYSAMHPNLMVPTRTARIEAKRLLT